MENKSRLGTCFSAIDTYPKSLSVIDDAGQYIRSLREDKSLIVRRGQSEDDNLTIQRGILYFLLLDREQTQFDFQDLILISRDGLKFCQGHLNTIVSENWPRLTSDVRVNVLRILIDFISFPKAESLFNSIFKRMVSGDLTQSNLWLVENMLNLIEEHKQVVLRHRRLLPLIAHTYLRLIPTHHQFSIATNAPNSNLARLCRKEIAFVVDLIRNHFDECFKHGGRDMLFMLQQGSDIPEFKHLWHEIHHGIEKMSSCFTNINEIFSTGTNKTLISAAIPFEMEEWILWTMKHVHHCSTHPYQRYQELFHKRFFSTPESQNLRPFLIRFIIRVFYPDNEMIGSTLMSRWAIISWIIVQASTATVAAHCKLALIYDWMFYDNKCDCIMDIEPAMLAIMHNLTKYSNVSIALVDFLVKATNVYFPHLRDRIISSVRFGLGEALRVNVFRSLGPLNDALRLQHPELHKQFAHLIEDNPVSAVTPPSTLVVTQKAPDNAPTATNQLNPTTPIPGLVVQIERNGTPKTLPPTCEEGPMEHVNKNVITNRTAPKISSPETTTPIELSENEPAQLDDISFDDLKRRFMKYSLSFDFNVERIDVPRTIAQIHSPVTRVLEGLYECAENYRSVASGRSREKVRPSVGNQQRLSSIDGGELSGGCSNEGNLHELCDKMEQVIIEILDDDNFDDTVGTTAAVICEICYPFFDAKLFSNDLDEDKLNTSLSSPVFVLLRNVCSTSKHDNKREALLLLLAEMRMRQPRVGYYLLYYTHVANVNDPGRSTYRDLCSSLAKPNLKDSLYRDLELLSNDDWELMVYLLPGLYAAFAAEMVGSPRFAHLVISSLDASGINLLGLQIHNKNLAMFDGNSAVEILKGSLEWGTIEQYFLWELMLAHNIPSAFFYGLVPYLDHKTHPEAIFRFSNFLRKEKPNHELIKLLLNRDVKRGDQFASNLLYFWSSETHSSTSSFVSVLHAILSDSLRYSMKHIKQNSHSQFVDEDGIDLVQILSHLDFMRLNCGDISFLQEHSIQSDLQQVLNSKSTTGDIKSRFSELFSFAVEEGENSNDKNTPSCRVFQHLDSRRYPSEDNTFQESNIQKTASKRCLFNGPDSSSSEDDSDSDTKPHASRAKRRLIIAD